MVNKNKQKGDRAERAVRDFICSKYPASFKTRAGFDDDLGDVIAMHHSGALVLQVKDVAKPAWGMWFHQLATQIANCRTRFKGNTTVQGGIIVHKTRGISDPSKWRAISTLGAHLDLLDKIYSAGYKAGIEKKEKENTQ